MIRTELAAIAMLAAADAIRGRGAGVPEEPRARIAWALSGAPFAQREIASPLDGIPGLELPAVERLSARSASALVEAACRVTEAPELLGRMHLAAIPRAERHTRGQFYTPPDLVARVLDHAGYPGEGLSLLDPMCGAGAFLIAALRRLAAARPDLDGRALADRVHGMDADPLACLLARAACWITLAA